MEISKKRINFLFVFAGILGVVFFLGATYLSSQAAVPTGYSEYYIPGDEQQLWDLFVNLDNDPALVAGQGMHTVIAVSAAADRTVIYYDHWEDGYDFDPANPGATADEIDALNAGDVQEYESSNIPIPRLPASMTDCGGSACYDGRDRLYIAGGGVTVTRSSWPESIGTVYALAWELYPTKPFQTNYTIPVGENLAGAPTNYDDFDRVYVIVQSTTANNQVQIDNPGTVGMDVDLVLNQGEVTQLYGIDAGTTISATFEVQAQFIVGQGHGGLPSEVRGFSAVPDQLWDMEYFSPVGGFASGNTEIYLYNPNSGSITISYQDSAGSGSFSLPALSTMAYSDGAGKTVPQGSAVYLNATGTFWGIGSGDSESYNYDWGYSLVPAYALQDEYFLGWAPGTSETTPTANGSPVFITPVQDNTTVYVDFSPTDGTADASYLLDRLDSQRVFDPDNENTGMHIWATGPVAVAWGEDPDTADIGTPYLDLGYTTLPISEDWMDLVLNIEKTADPTLLPWRAGETSTFSVIVSTDAFAVDSVVITDTLPAGWVYVSGSTVITLPDASTAYTEPVITGQDLFWNLLQNMNPSETMTVTFNAQTTISVPVGASRNDAQAGGSRPSLGQVFTPMDSAYVNLAALTIDKDTSTPSVEAGGQAVYQIVLENLGSISFTGVTASDTLPSGFRFASGSVTESNATRISTTDPTAGQNSLTWGTWDIAPGGAVTITFTADVDLATTPGTYDNTASASSNEFGAIDDDGLQAQDLDTPAGEDPEDDEDVTITPWSPDLAVEKSSSAGGGPVSPGDFITYTIVVTNTGLITHTGITISDTVPTGTAYVPGSAQVSYPAPTGNYADTFETVSYSNQDGTLNWAIDWDETGDDDSPVGGFGVGIFITANGGSNRVLIRAAKNLIEREADLSAATSATLTFDRLLTSLEAGDQFFLDVSANGGGSWTNLRTWDSTDVGASYVSENFDLGPYRSANTRIRFSSGGSVSYWDYLYFDNVNITLPGGIITTAGNPPPVITNTLSLQAGEVATVTFQVQVDNPLAAGISEIYNLASVSSKEEPAPQTDFTVDLVANSNYDFGDLPNGYGTTELGDDGARHVMSSLYLGSTVDAEPDGQANPDASGDGSDEDGIQRTSGVAWTPGATVSLDVTVTGTNGYLVSWFDWNNDGIFSAGEMVEFGSVSAGLNVLPLTIPGIYTTGTALFGHFRLFDGDPGTPSPTGMASGGEVEDYYWQFSPTAVTLTSYTAQTTSRGLFTGLPWTALALLPVLAVLGLLAWARIRYSWKAVK